MFFNTNFLKGLFLKAAWHDTEKQRVEVLKFFKENHGEYTPWQVHWIVLPNAPITSVRRAITNLTNKGLLVKTDRMVRGDYGQPNHLWKLAK